MARPRGSETRNHKFLENRLKAMLGEDFDPIIRAAEQATLLHAEASSCEDKDRVTALKASVDAWLKIGEHIHPKLKAIEVSGGDEPVKVTMIERKVVDPNNP